MIFLQGSKVICNIHDISHEEGQLTGHTFINNVHFPRTKTMHRSDYLLYQKIYSLDALASTAELQS